MPDDRPRHHDDDASPNAGDVPHGELHEITAAWQRAQTAVADSERRYQDLVEHSLGLICTHDLTGRLRSINPAAARSLGYERDQGVGRNLVEFLAPDTRHLFKAYLERIRTKGQDAGLMRVIARDGRERVWMYRNVLLDEQGTEPYVLGHAIDITERVVAERMLREQEQALRLAHDELDRRVKDRTDALEQVNERLRVEIAERQRAEERRERALIEQRDTLAFVASVSEALAQVLTFEQLVDVLRTLPVPFAADWTMVHTLTEDGRIRTEPGTHADPDRKASLAKLAALTSRQLSAESLVARALATGRRMFAGATHDLGSAFLGIAEAMPLLQQVGSGSVAVLSFQPQGQPAAAVSLGAADVGRFIGSGRIVIEDLDHRSRLALERIELYRQAQEANRVKDEFLSTLSHELRTPLNAVYGWARILRLRRLDKDTAHAVEVIERNAEAQIRLIEDVLDVSRIITGKMTLTMESLDVRAVLGAALDSLRPSMQAKRVQLRARLAENVPRVFADPHRLQQALWNVVSNAVKFTGIDGVITVTLRHVDDWVEIQVSDTGIGIRREVLPFVFDRFRQADSSTTRSYGGLGLGLAIVRQVVELHGGTVKADSAGETYGATFTIRLPVDRRIDLPANVTSANGLSAAAASSRPLRGNVVFVVEDDDDARELVASVLRSAGAEVMTAVSMASALDRMAGVVPDVLLLDLGLPGGDGCELLSRIREMKGFEARAVPAVALTAYARASDRDRALAAGFLHYLVKPVDPAVLVSVIAGVVAKSA